MRRNKTHQSATGSRAASCPQKAVDWQSCPRINGRAWRSCPRINGRDFTHKWSRPYIEPVSPVINTPVVRASPFGDKSSTCPPTGLHLPPMKRKYMKAKSKKWLLTILLTLPLLSQGQTIFGAPDCGQWVKDNNPNLKAWLLGYMSGLNVAHELSGLKPKDPLDKMSSAEQAFLWVDNYCQANPMRTVASAGWKLFQELKN